MIPDPSGPRSRPRLLLSATGLLLLAVVWQALHGHLYQSVVRAPLAHCHPAGAVPAMGWAAGFSALVLTLAAIAAAGLAAVRAPRAVAVLVLVLSAGLLLYDVLALRADFASGSLAPYACG
ncbi:hypothetical protein ACFYNO_02470 [Kitasatospora sp. NPDC006697]|uniref:hypothetical protein n=1 Tax=Kitasatospora sp. NPDC006697 TaxID=3364020 RepID=UPI0036A8E8D7